MNKEEFYNKVLDNLDNDFLERFLNASEEDIIECSRSWLKERIWEVYDEMPEEKLKQFEKELI